MKLIDQEKVIMRLELVAATLFQKNEKDMAFGVQRAIKEIKDEKVLVDLEDATAQEILELNRIVPMGVTVDGLNKKMLIEHILSYSVNYVPKKELDKMTVKELTLLLKHVQLRQRQSDDLLGNYY